MTTPSGVTIVVPVRDEADRIPAFVRAHSWAPIVVVDNGSRDASAAVARANGATVVAAPDATIGEARNVGADAATTDWILALDIDELADNTVSDELAQVLKRPDFDAWQIRRRNYVDGREQRRGSFGHDWVVRLYRRSRRFTTRKVHERLDIRGPLGTLHATLRHEPYRDFADHVARMQRYARWGAEQLHAEGRHASIVALTCRPLWRFVKAYLLQGQWLDGRDGLVAASMGAWGAWLKYAYLRALDRDASSGPR
jgi:glycosyltransferase involved in cell wall biosynthesis